MRFKDNDKRYYLVSYDSDLLYFYDYVPTIDSVFIPVFEPTTRKYTIAIYDWDESEIYKADVPYGTEYNTITEIPAFIYREPSKTMQEFERYAFKGYISASDFNNNNSKPTILDLSTMVVKGNFMAYAFYEIEDATKIASDESYFRFDNAGPNQSLTIHLANEKIRNEIKGKITLPSKHNGEIIKYIGDFIDALGVTHVYFLPDAEYVGFINDAGFMTDAKKASYSQLQVVQLPDTIRSIGSRCFNNCIKLQSINLNDDITSIGMYAFAGKYGAEMTLTLDNGLPHQLTSLGQNAFDSCKDLVLTSKLPPNLERIEAYTFNRCSNVNINIIGVKGYNNLKRVDKRALYGTMANGDFTVHIADTVESIGNTAFADIPIKMVYFEGDKNWADTRCDGTAFDSGIQKTYGNLGL